MSLVGVGPLLFLIGDGSRLISVIRLLRPNDDSSYRPAFQQAQSAAHGCLKTSGRFTKLCGQSNIAARDGTPARYLKLLKSSYIRVPTGMSGFRTLVETSGSNMATRTSSSKTARENCEALLKSDRIDKIEKSIRPSEIDVIGRLLARGLELEDAYEELHSKLSDRPPALKVFFDQLQSVAAFWSPDANQEARKGVGADSKLSHGGADDFLDYLEVVHVFIRGSAASRAALHQVGQTYWVDHSPARLSNEERAQELVP